ncbi:hypothetical protein CN311_16100 [Mesorhizobium sanjuanii]|uniref:Uncharacterized protein n=1 Tax=Mesorhizobium sanjuanii TaxID=2037900 RepID=A0A2A6FDR4_9HYPH|nr:hypothetical protein CN311_16100 [Mesorhizobium sanjuanii]
MLVELGVTRAVAVRDNRALFDWLLGVVQYQGMSDANVDAYNANNGHVGWAEIASAVAAGPTCMKLDSYWAFDGCGYRKTAQTCAEPGLTSSCSLPRLPLRNGRLSQAAFSLFLFMRDVCGGDLVGWIDGRLEQAATAQRADRRAAGGRPSCSLLLMCTAYRARSSRWRCRTSCWLLTPAASDG